MVGTVRAIDKLSQSDVWLSRGMGGVVKRDSLAKSEGSEAYFEGLIGLVRVMGGLVEGW